ncbi:unnamed protein product, partial [Staurois parvus]
KHNTVQTNPTNHPQITVHTSKRRQAGRVNINLAGRYRGSKRRMVGVTGQVQQVASSVVQRVRQRDGQGHKPGIRTGEVSRGQDQAGSATSQAETATGTQVTRYRGPWKNTHQGTDCRSGH